MSLSQERESCSKESDNDEFQIKRKKVRFTVKSKTYEKIRKKLRFIPRILSPMLKFDSPLNEVRYITTLC